MPVMTMLRASEANIAGSGAGADGSPQRVDDAIDLGAAHVRARRQAKAPVEQVAGAIVIVAMAVIRGAGEERLAVHRLPGRPRLDIATIELGEHGGRRDAL